MYDTLMSVDGRIARVLGVFPVREHYRAWRALVYQHILGSVHYRRSGRRVTIPSRGAELVSSGVLTEDQLAAFRRMNFRRSTPLDRPPYAVEEGRFREILGQDSRGEVWKVDTHPWSPEELKQFLIVRVGDRVQDGSWVYWKTEFGFSSVNIDNIEDPDVTWNPKYLEVCRKGVFREPARRTD